MALITWEPSIMVGVPDIDKQHKRLVDLINELHAAMAKGQGRDVVGRVVDALVSYTKEHFGFEERLMEQAGIAGLAVHKAQHKKFVDQLAGFRDRYNSGAINLSTDVLNFLSNWLTEHIAKTDKQVLATLAAKVAA